MDNFTVVLQVFLALAATLGLVLLCAFAARRFSGGGFRSNERIQILSVSQLGAKERLVLVNVEGKQVLLGVTQQNISSLHVFAGEHLVPEAEKPEFSGILKALVKRA